MDIFLIIGIIIGLGTVITGLLLGGTSIAALLNPEAAIIILIGTSAATMNSFTKKEILNVPKILGVLFKEKKEESAAELIKQLVQMSQETRKNGLLSLESTVQSMENKFMKKGLEMVVDGVDAEYIREVLEMEIDSMEERHRASASIFTVAGGSAPTLGVLGAVLGLISALSDLSDTAKLGEKIASAFVATLYGIFTGYVICHPFASRLKRKSSQELQNMHIMYEGILAIQSGANPKNLEGKLIGMLEPKERLKFNSNNSEN